MIGLFFLTLIVLSYKKERRKDEVNLETASFDFHPFQSASSQSSNWSVIKKTITSWFSSDKDSSDSGNSFSFLNFPNYGTMSSEEEDAVA